MSLTGRFRSLTYVSPLLAWTAVAWTLICSALVIGAIHRITHTRYAGEQRAAVRFRGTGLAELNGVPARVRPIVGGIIQLGHSLGLKVVTEGIETQAQLEVVHELGAELAQGYLLSGRTPLTTR